MRKPSSSLTPLIRNGLISSSTTPWPSRHLYHAMLNTSVGEDEAVNTILGLMEAANKKPEAGGS